MLIDDKELSAMFINVKKIQYILIVVAAVFFPVAMANLPPVFSNLLSKITILSFCALFLIIAYSSNGKIAKFLSTKPPTLFFLYLFLQSLAVVFTAGSSLGIFISSIIFLMPFLFVFIISSLLTSDLERIFVTNLLKLVLIVSLLSMVVDLAGYGAVFAGKYATILPERLGFRQIHGFMPWPNVMATTLVVTSLLLYIFEGSSTLMKLGYFLTAFTLVRAHIVTAIILFVISLKSKIFKVAMIAIVVIFATTALPEFIRESSRELSLENESTIYRLVYIAGAWEALAEYPILGIGINRMSNDAVWRMDNHKIHTKYSLPTELFSTDMASSDTNITFLAEIGFAGIGMYLIQLAYFVFLAIKLKRQKYILFLVPQIFWFYSFPSMLFSYNYGIFYWFLYGNLVALHWETQKLDRDDTVTVQGQLAQP